MSPSASPGNDRLGNIVVVEVVDATVVVLELVEDEVVEVEEVVVELVEENEGGILVVSAIVVVGRMVVVQIVE